MPAAETNETLASRLRSTRLKGRMTQKQLARAAQISQQTIAAIEAGKVKQPHHDTMERIAEALSISPAWLQFGIQELESLDKYAMSMAMMAMRMSEDQRKLMAMQMEAFLGESSDVDPSSESH